MVRLLTCSDILTVNRIAPESPSTNCVWQCRWQLRLKCLFSPSITSVSFILKQNLWYISSYQNLWCNLSYVIYDNSSSCCTGNHSLEKKHYPGKTYLLCFRCNFLRNIFDCYRCTYWHIVNGAVLVMWCISGLLLLTWFNIISALINYHISSQIWDKITYLFSNFNGCTI